MAKSCDISYPETTLALPEQFTISNLENYRGNFQLVYVDPLLYLMGGPESFLMDLSRVAIQNLKFFDPNRYDFVSLTRWKKFGKDLPRDPIGHLRINLLYQMDVCS